jgi:CubicO group peptidase (beta-lactamase class C family)
VFEAGNDPLFMTTPCDRPMTIRDLLSHQSGLTYGFMERTNVDAAYRKRNIGNRFDRDLAATMQELASVPLEFSPGTAWNYSVSTDVVGHLVELISGERYDEYLRRHIFEPLGMADTGFVVPEDNLDRFAACYERNRKKELRLQDDPQRSPYAKEPKFYSGGGGLVSTASDYLQFCRMLLNGGELDGARLLGPKTIELMTQNHIEDGSDISAVSAGGFSETTYDGIGFGLGFSVVLDTSRAQLIGTPGEFAWGGAASTAFWIDPVEELIVIFMTQFMPSRTFNFRGQLKSIIYPAIVD